MSSRLTAKVLFEYAAEQDDELRLEVGDIITNVIKEDEGWWKGELNGKRGMFPENFVEVIDTPEEKNEYLFKAIVRFDYDPEQSDELQLKEGDTVDVFEDGDEGWWKGRVNGKDGMFPSNFVERMGASKPADPVNKPLPLPDETLKQPEQGSDKPKSNIMQSLFSGISPGDMRNKLKKVAKPVDEDVSAPPQDSSPRPTQMVPPMNLDHEDTKTKKPMIPPADRSKATKPVQKAKVLYDYDPEQSDELKITVGMVITVIGSEFDGWLKGEVDGKVGVFPDNFVELLPLEQVEVTSSDVKEEAVSKPQLPKPAMVPNVTQLKSLKKAPPPPLPQNKPKLPGAKPKPTFSNTNPVKPPLVKPDNNADFVSDTKLPTPVQQPLKKPILPKAELKPDNKPDFSTDTKPHTLKEQSLQKPILPKADSNAPVLNTWKTADVAAKVPVPQNSINKPSMQTMMNNSLGQKTDSFNTTQKDSKAENGEIDSQESPAVMEEEKVSENKSSDQASLKFNGVKPGDDVKLLDHARSPGKHTPTKAMDKRVEESSTASPASSSSSNDQKEFNELKIQVGELQTKMAELEKKLKKQLSQVSDELADERKHRLSQQVELDNLKKKLDIWIG